MDSTLETAVLTLISILLLVFIVIYTHHTKHYNYWNTKGVPNKKAVFPFGSVKDLLLGKTYIGKCYDRLYAEFSGERYFGIIELQQPVLVLRDLELIKTVMVKDFDHFAVRVILGANPKEYILKHVINMSGQEWKEMRALLAPAFTGHKMKLQFDLMQKCCKQLKNRLNSMIVLNPEVEITDILARYTMDVIASCAFGLETNSICDPNCEFFLTVGALLRTTKGRFFRRFLINFFPSLVRYFPVKLIPLEITNLLTKTVRDTVTYREINNLKRNDFLDVLIKSRKNGHHELMNATDNSDRNLERGLNKGLTVEQMTAQAFVFFIAGYTTDTAILSFCLYELSRHQDIQDELHKEIHEVAAKHGGQVTYQALQDMVLLDQIVNEALRLYGSGQIIIRTCTKPYRIPHSNVKLEKGMKVIVPTYSLHHDPEYFPDPYVFKPERFSPENVKRRHQFAFLPFGEGPRNCIGRSFGLLQIKIGLVSIVSHFQLNLGQNQETPLKIDTRSIIVTPADPVYLKFERRSTQKFYI